MVSMAPHFDPYRRRRQWLQNLIQIGVNGSTFGSNSGAIDADMDQNVEPLTPSRLSLARKFKLVGLFKGG